MVFCTLFELGYFTLILRVFLAAAAASHLTVFFVCFFYSALYRLIFVCLEADRAQCCIPTVNSKAFDKCEMERKIKS